MHSVRSISILALLAAVVVGVALVVAPRGENADAGLALLYPALEDRINDVKTVTIRDADNEVVIENGEGGWVLPANHGYPADAGAVRALLLGLADTRIVEPKTAKPELYQRLGVSDVSGEGSIAVQVSLADAAGETLASVLVGKAAGAEDRYVRRADEARSLRVTGVDKVAADPTAWLRSTIIDVERDDIAAIEIDNDGERIALDAGEGGEMALREIPAGKQVKYQFALNDFASTIAGLELEDVRPAEGLEFDGELSGKAIMKEGLEVAFETAQAGDDTWFRFTASTQPDAPEESKARAGDMNALWKGWAYRLADRDLDRLGKSKADLLEDVEPGASGEDAPGADNGTQASSGDAAPENGSGDSTVEPAANGAHASDGVGETSTEPAERD